MSIEDGPFKVTDPLRARKDREQQRSACSQTDTVRPKKEFPRTTEDQTILGGKDDKLAPVSWEILGSTICFARLLNPFRQPQKVADSQSESFPGFCA